jgi:hypothetical protein
MSVVGGRSEVADAGLGAVRQKLPAIGARACSRNLTLEPGFQRHSHFFGAHESPADIYIFRSGVKRNQSIAVPAVRLKPVAYSLRPLPKNLRAFRAFYFDFFVDHETPLAD